MRPAPRSPKKRTPPPSSPKSQAVRVADVLFVGPLMVWGGARLSRQPGSKGGGLVLAGLGLATIVYNARNFLLLERQTPQ